jgi:hypothetical protein
MLAHWNMELKQAVIPLQNTGQNSRRCKCHTCISRQDLLKIFHCLLTIIQKSFCRLSSLTNIKGAAMAKSIYRRATGWMTAKLGFNSWQGQDIYLYSTASRPTLGPTQPPIQCVLGALSLGLKRPKREADRSHPSSDDANNSEAIPPLSKMSSWHSA